MTTATARNLRDAVADVLTAAAVAALEAAFQDVDDDLVRAVVDAVEATPRKDKGRAAGLREAERRYGKRGAA